MAVLKTVDFEDYKKKMFEKGWQLVNKSETVVTLRQIEAVSPYVGKDPGMEIGFTKFINGKGIRVTIWTTFEEEKGQTRDGWDAGHGVILISNKVVYLAPDVYRTSTFFERMLFLADLLEARAKSRPVCKNCGNLMYVKWTDANQYYWYCKGSFLDKNHPFTTERWDVGMPAKFIPFLKKKRRRTQLYNIKRVAENKPKKGQGKKKKVWKKKETPK